MRFIVFIGIIVFAFLLDMFIWLLTWTDDPRNAPATFSQLWAAVLSVLLLGCVIAAGIALFRGRQPPN